MGQTSTKEFFTFTKQELKILLENFNELDTNNSGFLEPDELFDVPELKENPIVQRVVSVFDENHDGCISFYEFVNGLTALSDGSSTDDKYKFAFQIYDINNDGFISNGDLFHMVKLLVGNSMNDISIQQIVDRTLIAADKDQDGLISFEEFVEFAKNAQVEEMFSMSIIDS